MFLVGVVAWTAGATTKRVLSYLSPREDFMKRYTAVVERDSETGLYVGHVPGFPGAHSQGGTLDELNRNLREVIAMLLEDGEPSLETEFVGIQTVQID